MAKIYKKIVLILTFLVFFISAKDALAIDKYRFEGIGFFAYAQETETSNYTYEGVAYYADANSNTTNNAIYKFFNKKTGNYLYTISETEKNFIANNLSYWWNYEGISFYAYKSQIENSKPVYRFYNKISDQHIYTISETEKNFIANNLSYWWNYEGISFYTYESQIENSKPVYRFYNKISDQYLYTINQDEYDQLTTASQDQVSPVYRFYNNKSGDHFYTISKKDRDSIINTPSLGYTYEGVAFYAYSDLKENLNPVYRFYNKFTGDHLYTISTEEKNLLESNLSYWWNYEGIAFFAYASNFSGAVPVYRLFNDIDHFFTISESDKNNLTLPILGPDISVGLWNYGSREALQNNPLKISANKNYNIKNKDGNIVAQVSGGTDTRVTYASDSYLEAYGSISNIKSKKVFYFDAADGDNSTLIFDVHRPNSNFDQYRGKIKIQYTDSSNIWVINTLSLEHYVWGDGEMSGTGDIEHTKTMATIFRTYGYWYIKYATKYTGYGFTIKSDSGNQIYSGYDHETACPNIKTAAQATRGIIASYNGDVALTPYSSWSDGRTRSFEERWGSTEYPWCKSVSDPYGKHATMSTSELEAAGNHMVGLIANGSLNLAGEKDWTYDRIMKYYYTGIGLNRSY